MIQREPCSNCGRMTYWHAFSGKPYCWPSCKDTAMLADGRAVWGENGSIIYVQPEGDAR